MNILKGDKKLEFILFLILMNPIVDLLTGVYLKTLNLNPKFTPGIIVRNLILMYLFYLVYVNKFKIKYFVILFLTFLFTNLSQILSGLQLNVFSETQYFLKFVYNLSILLVGLEIIKEFREYEYEKIFKYFTLSAVIYAVVVVVTFLLGVGYKTYSYSTATKGFFYAGNDLTAAISIVYPISLYLIIRREDIKLDLLVIYNLIIMLALVVIGTRVAYLAIFVSFIAYFVYVVITRNKSMLRQFVYMALLTVITFHLFSYMIQTHKNINLIENTIERQEAILNRTENDVTSYVLNQRNLKFKAAYEEYKDTNLLRKLFGISRSGEVENIEMDFADVFLFYGLAGFIIMTFYIVKYGIQFLLRFTTYKGSLLYVTLLVSLFIGFGSSFLAGHVLFSASAGLYAFLVLAVSNSIFE